MTGEFLALGAAIAAVPMEIYQSGYASLLIIGAALIGTSALFWYAFDLTSVGESPLTNKTVKNIRAVIIAMEMETQGAEVDWGNTTKEGGIPMDITSWLGFSAMDVCNIDGSIKIAIGDTLLATAKIRK